MINELADLLHLQNVAMAERYNASHKAINSLLNQLRAKATKQQLSEAIQLVSKREHNGYYTN